LYVSIIAQEHGVDLDTQTKLKLLNSKGHTVKNLNTKYEGNNAILSIPDIEAGNYILEAKVSSKAGKDTIQKEIYISDGNLENVTITLDKGIYKPGDTVNYRALLTSKENDEPISKDINVSIYDGNDNKVYNENVKSSDYGIISGSFSLANEVNSGLYKLVVKSKSNETTKQFKVNPYVTPRYEVKIEYDKESYLVGEKANITFNAKYFFGEAVDSSNYFVEATSSFAAGTDIFEVQLLSEYGTLVAGKKNDVYVFTNKADGTPLKTYITVSSNNFTKQIATDENGIGKFSIDVEQISSSSNYNYYESYNNKSKNTKQFTIVAEDTNGDRVRKIVSLDIEQKNLLVSTNKVKYEQGEDIKINISSITENAKNIYIPELVTTKGTAKVDLNLSDNITTWTIQTVGNTKDGRIGYGMLNNVKVFKDFFVDFELPKNLVETDNVSIPVTVYNYTDRPISTVLKIKQDDWFTLGNNNININVEAKSTNMVYVPISVLKAGNNKFRAEVSSNTLTDIVEKECTVSTKGYKVEKVVSTGKLDEDISEDILILEDTIENTAKAKVKIYASTMSQTIEGMENIFRMPTGCFEQISLSLYPNILALNYLEDNGIVNEEIKTKALSYISSGYQKLLTYEVKGESGGYSLYGHSPAETVLTAYGLMEISDLSEVYDVDDSVIEKMTNFLYKKQNSKGTFTITGSYIGGSKFKRNIIIKCVYNMGII